MRRRLPVPLAALACLLLPAGAAAAGPAWLPVGAPLSAAGADAGREALAVDRDGDVLAAWQREGQLEAVSRPAGGPFAAPEPLGPGDAPAAGFDAAGTAVLLALLQDGGVPRVHAFTRPDGGAGFGEPVPVSAAGTPAGAPQVEAGPDGTVAAAWTQPDGLAVAVRPPGATAFGAPQVLGAPGAGGNRFDLAVGADGTVVLVAARFAVPPAPSHVETATRPPGGAFGPLEPLASAVGGASSPAVDVAPDGSATAVFLLFDPAVTGPGSSRYRVHHAARAAGGLWSAAEPLSSTARYAFGPQVGHDADGTAIATFMQGGLPLAAVRPPGGGFAAPEPLAPDTHDTQAGPGLVVDAAGRAHVAWLGAVGETAALRTTTRPRGGSFGPLQTLTGDGASTGDRVLLAADGLGDAVALWQRAGGEDDRIELAAFDGAPPRLLDVRLPPPAPAGTPTAFAATAFDVWGPVTTTWDFGDGATASGPAVTHTYGTPATRTPAVTASDATGQTATASGPLAVLGAGASQPAGAPRLTKVTLTPARLRPATGGPTLGGAGAATLAFGLDRPGGLRVRIERVRNGRRSGGRCVAAAPRLRRRAVCTRYTTLRGSATVAARPGLNRVGFRARLAGRALAPGRHRLVVVASDAAGRRSNVRRLLFDVRR